MFNSVMCRVLNAQKVKSRTAVQLNCLFMRGRFRQMPCFSMQTGNGMKRAKLKNSTNKDAILGFTMQMEYIEIRGQTK